MAILTAGYNIRLEAASLAAYWDRLKKRDDDAFLAACQRLLDEGDRFPTVRALHVACDQERAAVLEIAARASLDEDAMVEAGRRNAARLKREGVESDRLIAARIAAGGAVARHPVGNRSHEGWLKVFDAALGAMERRLRQIGAEMDEAAEPAVKHDLMRRFETVNGAYLELSSRRATFAATGSVPVLAPPDPTVRRPDEATYGCLTCKDAGAVRMETTPGSKHFGARIPCPDCRAHGYAAYVAAFGQPTGMPWAERVA